MKNRIFKITFLMLIFAMFAFVVGCGEKENVLEKTYEELFSTIETSNVTENLSFPTKVGDVELTYASSNTKVISNTGVVTRGDEDETVFVLVKLSNGENTLEKTIIFTVPKVVKTPQITLTLSNNTITYGEAVRANVEVENTENKGYTWSFSTDGILNISINNVISVLQNVDEDKVITITCALASDPQIKAEAQITVKHYVEPSIKIVSTVSGKLSKGDSAMLGVLVTDAKIGAYSWSYSVEGIVSVSDTDVLKVIGDVTTETYVTVTVTLDENPAITDSIIVIIKAPLQQGNIGELTAEMLYEIGSENITVEGKLTDYYHDYNQSYNNRTIEYLMTVKMNEGKWEGSWCYSKNKDIVITDLYVRGTDIVTDDNGVTGNALLKSYINKNNEAVLGTVKNYNSVPAVWQSQHLWNHLSSLQLDKFSYDSDTDRYYYIIDPENLDDLYLMTYLAICLTPMLEDTIMELYFEIENGHITKMVGQTEVLLYGSDTNEDATGDSYTVIEVTFNNIGSTFIDEPAPFDSPEHADKLQTALENIKNAKNYTFHAVDTTTNAPSSSEGDYTIESAQVGPVKKNRVSNNTSATGVVGIYGQVTKNAVLLANTGKYEYSMDDKLYHTSYTGYYDYDETDGSFDFFGYNSSVNAMVGEKKYYGDMFDLVMPKFDISPNIFRLEGATTVGGVTTYTYVLRETSIMREVALELSCHTYAKDADASTTSNFKIVVNDSGELVSITFPYSLISGTYMGYITTTFSKIGTTKIDDDVFEGYVPRILKTSWSEYTTKYYSPNFSTQNSRDEDTSVVLDAVYGDLAVLLPSPDVFLGIVGDNIYGPFYDWKTVGTADDGTEINHGYIEITVKTDYSDENSKMSQEQWNELCDMLIKALNKAGYAKDEANSGSYYSYRYLTFTIQDPVSQDGIEIVIENNGTRYLWIYFYKLGDWKMKK